MDGRMYPGVEVHLVLKAIGMALLTEHHGTLIEYGVACGQ